VDLLPNAAGANDAPSFVQALREQLGLTVYPETTKVQMFVWTISNARR
jgi:uncharacterized protein DUF3738